ncbi:RNA polymerase sigma factor [Streptomyces atriruber]|uniref:RNA polymerase sigma factor n=1 Tax=Streptomyces atriruber TaxID=545121 RepID=A0ABV3BFE4_9ACTN
MTPQIPPEHWEEIAALYMRLRDDMVRFAARLLGAAQHLAHDVVQETFKAAALRWDTLRTRAGNEQRAWLYRVLKNKVFDQWGAAGRSEVGGLSDDLVADLDTPRTAVSHLLLRRCWKIIDSMSRAQRQVALLKWQGEWTTGEIAEHLNIAEATVRVHLRNARRALATELGSEVVFPSEWRDERPGEEAEHE